MKTTLIRKTQFQIEFTENSAFWSKCKVLFPVHFQIYTQKKKCGIPCPCWQNKMASGKRIVAIWKPAVSGIPTLSTFTLPVVWERAKLPTSYF